MRPANALYYGDNLEVLRKHIGDETIDLVYLDPPFNSNRDYNLLFKEQSGEPAQAQIKAFTDTRQWSEHAMLLVYLIASRASAGIACMASYSAPASCWGLR